MIPNEVIDRILDKTDIVEVIAGYISLKKAGQGFRGLCPFHKEKTPSFMVSPSKQIFHCFGCGAGGNAIGFLMKYEGADFINAVKMLADRVNIALPQYGKSEDRATTSLADTLFQIHNTACNFYQENLKGTLGKEAHAYLIQRGIHENTIQRFRLGFAPDSWQGLLNYCNSQGIQQEMLASSGLIIQNNESKNWYDRFRNRVMFPIFDTRNRVLGFGARALDNSIPKYINSPETHIYIKGKHLYGFNLSKEYIKRQDYVIIVEGYFDLILPYQNEVRNIVATLGTALTSDQITILRRFTKNAIIVYDADKAGQDATLRGLELLLEEDMNVRIAVLPKGSDPDSFVKREGRIGFMKMLKESRDIFDYKLSILTGKFRKNEPRGKARIIGEMLPTLAKLQNEVLKAGYLKKISEQLSVDEESVKAELKKIKSKNTYAPHAMQPETRSKIAVSLAELNLLALVFEDADFIHDIDKELGLVNFRHKHVVTIFEKISQLHKDGKKINPARLMSYFEDKGIEEIISEAAHLGQAIQDKRKMLADCLRHLKRDNLKTALHSLQSKIREAESASDAPAVNRLVAEYNDLVKGLCK